MSLTATINDWLFPICLYFLYWTFFMFFFYRPIPQTKIGNKPKMIKQIDSNPSLNPKSKVKERINNQLKNLLLVKKILIYIASLDRYKIYRLCIIFGLKIKTEQEYLSLDLLRFQLKQIFRKYPTRFISALAHREADLFEIVLSGNNY